MMFLKQSTAATVKMGPFLDSTDGDTAETALTIAQADIRLSKNGGAYAQTNNAAGATHDENGEYDVPLDATDTGTLGRLKVFIHVSGALAVWREFMVVPANVYDALVGGSDTLETDMVKCGGATVAAGAIPNAAADAPGGLPISDAGGLDLDTYLARLTGNVALASVCTEARLAELDAGSLPADVNSILLDTAEIGAAGAGLTAIPWNAAWDAEVQSECNDALMALNLHYLLAAATAGADMTVEVVDNSILSRIIAKGDTSAFDPSTDGLQPIRDRGDAAWVTATPPAAAAIADAVWEEPIADHATDTTFGGKNQKAVPSESVDAYKADVGNLDAKVSSRATPSDVSVTVKAGD